MMGTITGTIVGTMILLSIRTCDQHYYRSRIIENYFTRSYYM